MEGTHVFICYVRTPREVPLFYNIVTAARPLISYAGSSGKDSSPHKNIVRYKLPSRPPVQKCKWMLWARTCLNFFYSSRTEAELLVAHIVFNSHLNNNSPTLVLSEWQCINILFRRNLGLQGGKCKDFRIRARRSRNLAKEILRNPMWLYI